MTRRGAVVAVIGIGFVLGNGAGLGLGDGAGMGVASAAPLDDHSIELVASAEVTIGEQLAVSLTLEPRPSFRISTAGPIAIELAVSPEPGLRLARRTLRRADAADRRAAAPRFDLGLRGDLAGDYKVTVEARFWVCGKRTCRPVRATRTVAVHVAEPPPPAEIGPTPPVEPATP